MRQQLSNIEKHVIIHGVRALHDGKLIIKRNANTNGTETVKYVCGNPLIITGLNKIYVLPKIKLMPTYKTKVIKHTRALKYQNANYIYHLF